MLRQRIYRASARKAQRQTVAFGGLNYAEDAADGELRASAGLTSASYPVLSQRPPRRKLHDCARTPNALFAWDKLVEVEGTTLLYDGRNMGELADGEKQFAVVANKLVVWPDRKVLDLSDLTFRDYTHSVTSLAGSTTTFTQNSVEMSTEVVLRRRTTAQYTEAASASITPHYAMQSFLSYASAQAGQSPQWDVGFLWGRNDSNIQPGTLLAAKKSATGDYSPINRYCFAVPPPNDYCHGLTDWDGAPNTDGVYLRVTDVQHTSSGSDVYHYRFTYEVVDPMQTAEKFTDCFRVGDRVKLSGARSARALSVSAVAEHKLTFAGTPLAAGTSAGEVTVSFDIPDLDFICAKNNRLWGFSNADQTIYSSALGLPMDFWDESGLATGSWQAPVGSAGEATGIAAYSDAVLVWKEDRLYKVMGDFPAQYGYVEYSIGGVQAGCDRSQVVVSEALYFLGREGVYRYTGDLPQLVSGKLGDRRFSHGVAGTDGRRYYISMRDDASGEWGLYCFDTLRGVWLREDATEAADFARLGNSLYMLSRTDSALYELNDPTAPDEPFEWLAEFAPFDETTHRRKGYTRIRLRLDMQPGAWLVVETKQDREPWRRVWTQAATRSMTVNIPLRTGRCDRCAVRLSGRGRTEVRSMVREFVVGSEV